MTRPPPNWNARWAAGSAEGGRLYGAEANAYLLSAVAMLGAPETALLLADGDGRNSQHLARLGARVTAVDLSSTATELARAYDRADGLDVERVVGDLAEWSPPPERRWSCVGLLYLQTVGATRRRAARIAAAALEPGGWLLVEGFAKAQAGRAGLGPDDPDKLYSVDELLEDTRELTPLEALEGEILLDEGPRHQGTARVARLLARRPE